MSKDPVGGRKTATVLIAFALTLSGVVSILGVDAGYTDALFEPDYTILHAPPEGPLAEAGFQVGDSVVSVEGIPVADLGMYSRWPRSLSRAPGESLAMVVERDGDLITGDIVSREQPSSVLKLQIGFLIVLLAFLWSGVWALAFVPSVHSRRLASVGLAAGFGIPFANMGSWNGVTGHINLAAEVLWILLLFRFFLFFPKSKRIAQGHLSTVLMYAPWVVFLGCLVVELIYHPRFYHSFGGYMGLLLFGYLLSAVAALIHSWVKTPGKELGPSGLKAVLVGFGLGLGGILVWAADSLLLSAVHIPGTNWAPILFAAVPIGMALGVRRAARKSGAEQV